MNRVFFLHLRHRDHDLNQTSNFGGATIAYTEVPGGVMFAMANCAPTDNYNKRYGRDKAQGRLKSVNHQRFFPGTFNEFRKTMISSI
jgi:hypothetical protein